MKKLVLIFDYFKEAFHINKQNKSLYKPQIALIAVKALLILFVGMSIYSWIGIENFYSMADSFDGPREALRFILDISLKLLILLLAYALISVIVESGLLNMYKKAVMQGYTESGDFAEGISKYFVKLLLGELFIIVCFVLSLPFYLILGVITLTAGLTLIPIIAGVFLTMWKISLVMNDIGLFAAIGDSFGFAKRNFFPLTVLQVIHWSFTNGISGGGGGGGGSSNFNLPSNNGFDRGFDGGFGREFFNIPGLEAFVKVMKTIIAILIPIITIATISASVIAMIFEVFFMLALFVAYKNGFKVEEPPAAELDGASAEPVVQPAEEISYFEQEKTYEETEDLSQEEPANGEVEQ